jgi:hypothetical protein
MRKTSDSAQRGDTAGSRPPSAKRPRTSRGRHVLYSSADGSPTYFSVDAEDDAHAESAVDELFPRLSTLCATSSSPVLQDVDPTLWLAERVDRRRPGVLRDLLGRSDDLCALRAWLMKDPDAASALVGAAPSFPVTSFVSQAEMFYLDGTTHPRAVLTTSMSMETTIAEHVRPSAATSAGWPNRYAVEDIDSRLAAAMQLPVHSPCHTALGGDECGSGCGDGNPRSSCTDGGSARLAPARGDDDSCCVAKRQIFLTVGRSQTQLHRDTFANLYLCLSGWRIWELAHPAVSPQLQRSPGSVSALDRLPSSMKLSRVTLRAGDAIFVPRGWWHRVEAVGDMLPSRCSVAVNWYYSSRRVGDSCDEWPTT